MTPIEDWREVSGAQPRQYAELRRIHVKNETWDKGNPEAVDGFVTWCAGCGQRPWPCDTAVLQERVVRLIQERDALAAAAKKADETMACMWSYSEESRSKLGHTCTVQASEILRAALSQDREGEGT